MASVEIQTPDGVVQAPLDRDHLTIGRLASNTIALPYPHISRWHDCGFRSAPVLV